MRFRAPAEEKALPGLRRRVQEELRARGVESRVVADAGLLVSELAHNAVAARTCGGREVRVEVEGAGAGVRLRVECDANRDLESLQRALDESTVLPGPESERGRGLWLVLALSRELRVERTADGLVRVSLLVKPGS